MSWTSWCSARSRSRAVWWMPATWRFVGSLSWMTSGRGGRGGGAPGDEKGMYRAELRTLSASIAAALAKTTDHETKAHLEASRDEIAKILDPKFLPAAPAAAAAGGGRGGVLYKNR